MATRSPKTRGIRSPIPPGKVIGTPGSTSGRGMAARPIIIETVHIDPGAVTYPTIQPVGGNSILGNPSSVTGTVQEIKAGFGIRIADGRISAIDPEPLIGDFLEGIAADSGMVDIVYDEAYETLTASLIPNSVTVSYMHATGRSLVGRSTAGPGQYEEIALGNGLTLLSGSLSVINDIADFLEGVASDSATADLVYDEALETLSVNVVPVKLPTQQNLTSGTTYTTPTGCRQLRGRMYGAGAGGCGSGSGSPGAGGAGGDSSFNSITAKGAAAPANSFTGGLGGTGGTGGTGGNVRMDGNPGQSTGNGGVALVADGGLGGSSPLGGAGAGSPTSTGGTAPANSGSGGGGAGVYNVAGSTGGAGGGSGEYVEFIINNPNPTYTYAIGTGGTAGTAGTSGSAGGAGGSGRIIVDEIY